MSMNPDDVTSSLPAILTPAVPNPPFDQPVALPPIPGMTKTVVPRFVDLSIGIVNVDQIVWVERSRPGGRPPRLYLTNASIHILTEDDYTVLQGVLL